MNRFELAVTERADGGGFGEIVEDFDGKARGGDPDLEAVSEGAKVLEELFVSERGGDDELADMGPKGIAEALEEVFPEGLVSQVELEFDAREGERGTPGAAAEVEKVGIDRETVARIGRDVPFEKRCVWKAPEVLVTIAFGEGFFEAERKAPIELEVAIENGAEFVGAGEIDLL